MLDIFSQAGKRTLVAQKHRAISRQEKMAFSSPRRVALGLPCHSPRICTDVRAYADVTTKISHIDWLPDFLTHSAAGAFCALEPR